MLTLYFRTNFGSANGHSHAQGPIVTVIVGQGQGQKTFYLPETLLRAKSPYFKTCLWSRFIEAASRAVSLPDDNPAALACFITWLYVGQLSVNDIFDDVLQTYVLADKLMCLDLKNEAVDALLILDCRTNLEDLRILAEAGFTESKMMDYLLSQVARFVGWENEDQWGPCKYLHYEPKFHQFLDDWPEIKARWEYLSEISMMLKQAGGSFWPEMDEGCRYHEHEQAPEEPCKRWPRYSDE